MIKRHIPAIKFLSSALAAVFLCHCSAPVSVRMEKPVAPAGVSSTGLGIEGSLASIRDAHDRIRRGDDSAIPAYNHSVARLIEALENSGADPWGSTLAFNGASGAFRLKGIHPAGSKPLERKLIPTDTLRFRGEMTGHQSKVAGLGAPVVEVGSIDNLGHTKARDNLPLRNLTALVRFEGNLAKLELVDPYQIERVSLGRDRPLAADYGAAIMLGMSHARVDKLGLVRLLRPTRYNDTANLNFLQPYDAKRIPVLFVHGLDSTPATFAPMYFNLLEDPEIRKNYQFWVFSYPSGYPYPYSASLLRRELDDVKHAHPDHKNMVIIGHSMGSLITRLMVTDPGDKIWISAFGKSPSETKNITGRSREILLKAIVFEDRKEIDRAVFFSGPHRGSEIATNWIGRTASRLVKMPGLLADTRNVILSTATADVAGLAMSSAPNSIGTLSPKNPFVVEINKHPITSRVPYHSIMGDRGKGDTPNSSDGIVAYWSSHLDGAVSEKIVPSGHGSHAHPEGIEEARRILKLHLNSR